MIFEGIQGSYALKPRPLFCRTLSPGYKKDSFLPKEFITHKLEDNFMLLVVAESYKKMRRVLRAYEPCYLTFE